MKFPSPGQIAAKALSLQSGGFSKSGAASMIKGAIPDGAVDRLKAVNQKAQNGISKGKDILNQGKDIISNGKDLVNKHRASAESMIEEKTSQVKGAATQAEALIKHGGSKAKTAARNGLSMARGLLGF
jgi:hypothetical protein